MILSRLLKRRDTTESQVVVLFKNRHDDRPVFLDLLKIHLPVPALVSILHRITGVAKILAVPILVYLLLAASQGLNGALIFKLLPTLIVHLIEWLIVVSYMYHVLAGVRHLYHDFSGIHTVSATRLSSYVVLVVWGMWMLLASVRVRWGMM